MSSMDSHMHVPINEIKFENFHEVTAEIRSGDIKINVHSNGIIMKMFVKILEEVNQTMILVAAEQGKLTTLCTKKLIIALCHLRLVEC